MSMTATGARTVICNRCDLLRHPCIVFSPIIAPANILD
jgi:hypothetical protein